MYYPLSQITTNLYTNGNEFIIASNKALYTGYYWRTSTGETFSGRTPQDPPIERLLPYNEELKGNTGIDLSTSEGTLNAFYNQDDYDSVNYIKLKILKPPPISPLFSLTLPTSEDYQIGEFRRYFCKKTNEIIYLEISTDTYNRLVGRDPKIQYQYYQPFNISWQLTGDKEQVFTTNRNIVELIMKQQKLPQFDLYLKKDYTKYYQ